MTLSLRSERSKLLQEISSLKTELENSIALYDRYKERARVTLGKATADQEDAQRRLNECSTELHNALKKLKVASNVAYYLESVVNTEVFWY